MTTIGVLALQGAFIEHERAFQRLEVETRRVTLPAHLAGLDGLVIPGGESTTIGKLMVEWALLEPIRDFGRAGKPILGSCAGAIVLAGGAGHDQPLLRLMDMQVERNAFGRQVESFEAPLCIPALGDRPFPGIFIRAPKFAALGPAVRGLCRLSDGAVVAAQQGTLLAVSFHAELTSDPRLHQYFLGLVDGTTTELKPAPAARG